MVDVFCVLDDAFAVLGPFRDNKNDDTTTDILVGYIGDDTGLAKSAGIVGGDVSRLDAGARGAVWKILVDIRIFEVTTRNFDAFASELEFQVICFGWQIQNSLHGHGDLKWFDVSLEISDRATIEKTLFLNGGGRRTFQDG